MLDQREEFISTFISYAGCASAVSISIILFDYIWWRYNLHSEDNDNNPVCYNAKFSNPELAPIHNQLSIIMKKCESSKQSAM